MKKQMYPQPSKNRVQSPVLLQSQIMIMAVQILNGKKYAMPNTTKSTGKNQRKGNLRGIGTPRILQVIVSELAQIFSWVKSTILK